MDPVLRPPAHQSAYAEWIAHLTAWRQSTRALLGYTGASYETSAFRWTRSIFSLCMLMPLDEEFAPRGKDGYDIDAVLDRGERDYGGFDAVLFWNGYPRIGLDNRNQFDFWRESIGGLEGFRRVVDRCHERGVRCLVPLLPWDRETRPEAGPMEDALVELVRELDLDGVFLDTIPTGSRSLRSQLDAVCPGIVFSPERVPPVEQLDSHHLAWMQGAPEEYVPGILRNRWFEQRHRQFEARRWTPHHDWEVQRAWLNGSGVLIWENVFGTWVGTDARFKSTLRSMLPAQRFFAELFAEGDWTPLVPTLQEGVFAGCWRCRDYILITLINRTDSAVEGAVVSLEEVWDSTDPVPEGVDVLRGERIALIEADGSSAGSTSLPPHGGSLPSRRFAVGARIPAQGIAGVALLTDAASGATWEGFLAQQRLRHEGSDRSRSVGVPPEVRVSPRGGELPGNERPAGQPPGISLRPGTSQAVPGASFPSERGASELGFAFIFCEPHGHETGEWVQTVRYRVRECHYIRELEQVHWREAKHESRSIEKPVRLRPFEILSEPVTNGQFHAFVTARVYRAPQPESFLAHWRDGAPLPGSEDEPVVYVSIEDARAFARWAGLSIPTEEEWQHAAETEHSGRSERAHGAAGEPPPFEYGQVWELTESERSDGHTRYLILKGGAPGAVRHIEWYMDSGRQEPQWSTKMILMSPRLDRCSTVGFRCIKYSDEH